jgi:hypothetical protein
VHDILDAPDVASVGAAMCELVVEWHYVTPSELASHQVMENPMKVQVYTHPG